ncbi:MAG: hypothetical protein ABSE05_15000 [Syntrophales bacterium]|jgi:hypothetical protein
MKILSPKMKEEALSDLKMYFGKPPYDIEHIRRFYRSSGLFDQQALAKYGRTPIELIRELQAFYMTEKIREEALKDLEMYFGEPPAKEETVRSRLSSGLLEMQILAKYLITVDELMSKVGYAVIQ